MWKMKEWDHKIKRQVVTGCVGCALILGAFAGASRLLPRHEPVVIDPASIVTAGNVPAAQTPEKAPFAVDAKGAVLMDASTGEVLFQQDSHEKLPLASVTKVMTMLLVMEAVDAGRITLEDSVTISERAASMGGSQMFMEPGETHTVAQLMEGVAMASANDGCVAFKIDKILGENQWFRQL